MKKVGIFGGSFNPIHTGHIALAKSLCEKACLDEVWFMVSPMNPFKKTATDLLDDQLRLEMVEKRWSTSHTEGMRLRVPPA